MEKKIISKNCTHPIYHCSDGIDTVDCWTFLNERFDEFKATVGHESYFDTNGYKLDDSIIGIEIIGNVTDNPELMKLSV